MADPQPWTGSISKASWPSSWPSSLVSGGATFQQPMRCTMWLATVVSIMVRCVTTSAIRPSSGLARTLLTAGRWVRGSVTADALGDPWTQTMETRLNGEIMRSTPISDLAFSIPELIAYLSIVTELLPGVVAADTAPRLMSTVPSFHALQIADPRLGGTARWPLSFTVSSTAHHQPAHPPKSQSMPSVLRASDESVAKQR